MCDFLVCSEEDCDHSSSWYLSFTSHPAGVSLRRVDGSGCGDTVTGGDGGGDAEGKCGVAKSDKDNNDEKWGGGGDDTVIGGDGGGGGDTVIGGDGDGGDTVTGGDGVGGDDGKAKSNGDNKRLPALEMSVTGDCRIENRGDTDEGDVDEEV